RRFGDAAAHRVAVQGVDAHLVDAQLLVRAADDLQPLADDFRREPGARQRRGAAVADLSLADPAVAVADARLVHAVVSASRHAGDAHAVLPLLMHGDPAEIRRAVRREVAGGVLQLVDDLLLAGHFVHDAAG